MRLVCLFYRFFASVPLVCTASHPFAPSAMSMLLAIQLYVAHMLSSDPSHLENAASDAYVGSHVCHFLKCPALQLVSHLSAQNSVNRQLGIASVNAYKPLALLCFFIEVPSCPLVHPSRILSPNISCAAVARRPCCHLPTSPLGVFLIFTYCRRACSPSA
jgi:hypothetical protein